MNLINEQQLFMDILNDQFRRYPFFAADDIYKLCHQAAMGNKHAAAADRKSIIDSINKEWAAAERVPPASRLLDIIDPRGKIMRVDIRLFKKAGGDPEKLADIFIESSEIFIPDTDYLRSLLNWAAEWTGLSFPVVKEKLQLFFKKQERLNYPAVSHSRLFAGNYRPSYRIVYKRLWQDFRL
jgi:hypothetical protein